MLSTVTRSPRIASFSAAVRANGMNIQHTTYTSAMGKRTNGSTNASSMRTRTHVASQPK